MLVASSLRDSTVENDDKMGTIEVINMEDFSDFSTGSLLDSIDFDELFAGLDNHDDENSDHMLTDLEILRDYSIEGSICDDLGLGSDDASLNGNHDVVSALESGSGQDTSSICSMNEGEEGHNGKSKKSAAAAGSKAGRSKTRCIDGKRKAKVDWTPELHKRFVQAVEQLGEKAVPSRILEVMCTDGLTRHNIASHLQKYRSHRKHLIAREAEAASWNQRRHIGGMAKRVVSPWLIPNSTIGYPPMSSMPPHHMHHSLVRPLHVWGHPSLGNHVQTPSNMWSKHFMSHHLSPPPTHLKPHPVWTPPPRPVHYGPSQGMPLFPPPVSGIPHHALYKNNANAATGGHLPPSPLCSTPSNERIDAAFEDVLAKPWLPLPIGLKPPAIEIVVGELQRQGVPQIPPS